MLRGRNLANNRENHAECKVPPPWQTFALVNPFSFLRGETFFMPRCCAKRGRQRFFPLRNRAMSYDSFLGTCRKSGRCERSSEQHYFTKKKSQKGAHERERKETFLAGFAPYHFYVVNVGEAPDEDVHVDQRGGLCNERFL